MERQFEIKITGSEGKIDGIAHQKNADGSAWEFKSIDGSVHLVIAKDDKGNWRRMAGTEPYLSVWVDELAQRIKSHT
jgi:hypothetical protein